eukprot:CAMPEP_0119369718 /NCGR_PEP_ID=MMETSP1334-20130426/16195_1 /TAXON_ID=127549 /ORGANISM="Calcidiscus leptoporus, Strain RCC1130" /LENGTH=325 /DNA_ID=CAMNT_0007386621 /DNA_START=42 /DNA_END=1019 /DNA_ORIENTATION=+
MCVSTRGIVGGYVDLVEGSAVLTIPVARSDGSTGRCIARVEAEAEWVGAVPVDGEPGQEAKMRARWLLRHMELEADGDRDALVLYSLPAALVPSPWTPSREPSLLPRDVRAFFPELAAMTQSREVLQLAVVGTLMVAMHTFAFVTFRRQQGIQREYEQLQRYMLLRPEPWLVRLQTDALAVAEIDRMLLPKASDGKRPTTSVAATEGLLYGSRRNELVQAFTVVQAKDGAHAVLFEASKAGSGWQLEHVSLTRPHTLQEGLLEAIKVQTAAEALAQMIHTMPSLLRHQLAAERPSQPPQSPPRKLRPGMMSPSHRPDGVAKPQKR